MPRGPGPGLPASNRKHYEFLIDQHLNSSRNLAPFKAHQSPSKRKLSKIYVAAPEQEQKQASKSEKTAGKKGKEPMIYAEEEVEYADGAVVKVRLQLNTAHKTTVTPRQFLSSLGFCTCKLLDINI